MEEIEKSLAELVGRIGVKLTENNEGKLILTAERPNAVILAQNERLALLDGFTVTPGPLTQIQVRVEGKNEQGETIILFEELFMDAKHVGWSIPEGISVTRVVFGNLQMGGIALPNYGQLTDLSVAQGRSVAVALPHSDTPWENLRRQIPENGFPDDESANAFLNMLERLRGAYASSIGANPYLLREGGESAVAVLNALSPQLAAVTVNSSRTLRDQWLYTVQQIEKNIRQNNTNVRLLMGEIAGAISTSSEDRLQAWISFKNRFDGKHIQGLSYDPLFAYSGATLESLFDLAWSDKEKIVEMTAAFKELRSIANVGGPVRNYLAEFEEFLKKQSPELYEFFKSIPISVQNSIRMAQGYWKWNTGGETNLTRATDLVIGNAVWALASTGNLALANRLIVQIDVHPWEEVASLLREYGTVTAIAMFEGTTVAGGGGGNLFAEAGVSTDPNGPFTGEGGSLQFNGIPQFISPVKSHDLGTIENEGEKGSGILRLPPGDVGRLTFELQEPMMVNLWTNAILDHDLTLRIMGGPLPTMGYSSQHPGVSGESVSLKLTPGIYTLSIEDKTAYGTAKRINGTLVPAEEFNVLVQFDILPYRTQEIMGRVSIAGNPEAKEVSMRVAEFIKDAEGNMQRNTNYDGSNTAQPRINELDPTKPVWVVVHGMNSNENEDKIDNLAKALYGYAETEEIQLVTVNWDEAAKDIIGMGRDAPWTNAVGTWVARQLIAAGMRPSPIDGIGHSHGTYTLYALGKELLKITGEPMNTLVALDPAGNVPLISNFDHGDINFSSVAKNSIAFESSMIADSDWLASSANTAFHVESPSTVLPTTEHQLGLTAFTEILNHERVIGGHFSNYFSLRHIMNPPSDFTSQYVHNVYEGNPDMHPGGEFEGVIEVWVSEENGKQGNYFQAHPSRFRFRKPGTEQEQIIPFDSFV